MTLKPLRPQPSPAKPLPLLELYTRLNCGSMPWFFGTSIGTELL